MRIAVILFSILGFGAIGIFVAQNINSPTLTTTQAVANPSPNPKPSDSTPFPTTTKSVADQVIAGADTNSNTFITTSKNKTPTPSPTVTPTPTPTPTGTPRPGPCDNLVTSAYDWSIIDDSPIAYFAFNNEGAICDHSPNRYQAVSSGKMVEAKLPNGERAWDFDGSNYITIFDADGLSPANTGRFTVEAWIRPDSLQFSKQEGTGYIHWMGKGETGKQEWHARMYSLTNSENRPNRISGYAFNPSGGLGVGSYFQDSVTAGDWIHFAFVINTRDTNSSFPMGYSKVYKNGSLRDTDTLSTLNISPVNGTAPMRIGTRDLNSFFEGAIGKVAIFDRELTPFEVLAHYQAMVPTVPGTARYVKNIGNVNTKATGTSLTINVTESVNVGNTIIVRVLTDYTASAPTITDSKGNTYTRDRTAPNSGTTMRAAIFSAPITSALSPGDTITITTPSTAAKVAIADEFSGLLTSGVLDVQNGTSGSSTTPGTSISINTTHANSLVLGFVGVEGPQDEDTYTEDALGQFASLPRGGTIGDTDTSNLTINGGFKSVSVTGNYKHQPTLDPTRNWILFIMSYKAE
jgi:Concanavalin A-like lectin/glucanases superfamily